MKEQMDDCDVQWRETMTTPPHSPWYDIDAGWRNIAKGYSRNKVFIYDFGNDKKSTAALGLVLNMRAACKCNKQQLNCATWNHHYVIIYMTLHDAWNKPHRFFHYFPSTYEWLFSFAVVVAALKYAPFKMQESFLCRSVDGRPLVSCTRSDLPRQ